MDGAHNEPLNWTFALQWLKDRAQARLQEGTFDSLEEERFWEKAIEYAQTHQQFEKWYETELWDNYIGPAGGYGYSPESEAVMGGIPHYLLGRANFILERVNLRKSEQVFRDSLVADSTPSLKKIKIPTLIVWGKHDGAVVVVMAREAYENLGTEKSDK